MGMYFNPPSDLNNIARKLDIQTHDYCVCISQLIDNEKLFGLYDRIIFQNAPYLFNENEFNEFYKQVGSSLMFLGYYGMPEAFFNEYFGIKPEEVSVTA